MRILIVEDDVKMASLMRRGLREEGMAADVAERGEDAVWIAGSTDYDAVVLDVMLPGMDGFETCRRLRADGVWAPVLMLTARDAVEDRVKGLDEGADDYLVKPFSFAELLARLRALVRRGPVERPTQLKVGNLRLDPATHQAWRGKESIELSQKEFALLETLMRRPGEVLSRYQLLEHVLGLRLREPFQRRRRLHPLPAGEGGPALRHQEHRHRARRRLPDAQGRRILSRLPLKLKLTLAFAGVMALVLIATGLFVYLRLESELDAAIDEALRSRADEVAALDQAVGLGASAAAARQALRAGGQLRPDPGRARDGGRHLVPDAVRRPIITGAEVARARLGTLVVSHDSVPGVEDGEARLLATPVQARDRELIVVVGTTLADRNEALGNLRTLLLIGGPIALLLASLAGYGVTALALRPVERMRRQAAEISTAEPGVRLPVPPTDDEIGRLGQTLNAMLARLEEAFQRERTFARTPAMSCARRSRC